MDKIDYDQLFHEVTEELESKPGYRDYVRSVYAAMTQFNVLMGSAASLMEQHGIDPKDWAEVVGTLLRLMEVVH